MDFLRWNDLPWTIFRDPFHQWEVLPTFLGIEYVAYFLTVISLVHAVKNDRNHLMVWIASFITGSANDIFFMALPMVDNFWQAQATIMLSPRLPLYICCIYNIFLYYSTITSWRLGFENMWPEAAITGILALLIYHPYDLIGVKHLWWTWHTTDPPIMNRLFGVPLGSSVWILTFSACFSIVLYICRGKFQLNIFKTLMVSCLVTTPLMIVIMTILQVVSFEQQGVPSFSSFNLCLFVYITVIIIYSTLLIDTRNSYKWIEHRCFTKLDLLLGLSIVSYYAFLIVAGNYGKPDQFKSLGVHQDFGPCNVTVTDVMGLTREKYACSENMPSEWDFRCINFEASPVLKNKVFQWYTICGTPHPHGYIWKTYLNIFASVSAVIYFSILIFLTIVTRRRKFKRKEQ